MEGHPSYRLDIRSHIGSKSPSEDVVCWCVVKYMSKLLWEVGYDEDCKNNELLKNINLVKLDWQTRIYSFGDGLPVIYRHCHYSA